MANVVCFLVVAVATLLVGVATGYVWCAVGVAFLETIIWIIANLALAPDEVLEDFHSHNTLGGSGI